MGLLRGIDLNESIAPYRSCIKIYGCTAYALLRNFGHQSISGFLGISLMAACTLLYRQSEAGEGRGCPRGAREGCGWGLWARRELAVLEKQKDAEQGWEETAPIPLDHRKEVSSGAQGAGRACHNPESCTKLGGEEQPGRVEEEVGILS